MGNKWGSREGSPESKGEIVELLTAFWLRLDSVLNCITSWQEWCWVGVQTVSTVLYLVLYMYLYVLYPHPPIDITVCNSYLEVCLQAPYRNTISLHYINITRSDQPIRSSSLININAKWLWLFTYMTIGLQHHLFLQISSDVSHAREKKNHSCFSPCCQQDFWGSCHTTTTVVDAFLEKPSYLPLNWPQRWLLLLDHCSADPTRCYNPLLVLRWRCSYFHISFKLLFRCQSLSSQSFTGK